MTTKESITPACDRIRALWPATTNKGYATYLSPELDAMVEQERRDIPLDQVYAMLNGLRQSHDQFPGLTVIRKRLRELREASLHRYENTDQSKVSRLVEILQSPTPLIRIEDGDPACSAYTAYWLDRAARVMLNRVWTLPAPTTYDPDRFKGPADSPDDIHIWHGSVAKSPNAKADDPNFRRSVGSCPDQDSDSKLIQAAANVCSWLGWHRVMWRGTEKQMFDGVTFREQRATGHRSMVRLIGDA
jgi:hypothetical protein